MGLRLTMLTKYKIALVAAVAAFVVGLSAGSSLMYKWAAAQESGRLRVAIEIQQQERSAALASLKNYYENLPPTEVIKTEIEEVIKYVPTAIECDVSPREHRMLDYARTGVRDPAGRVDAGPGKSGASDPSGRVPRAAEVRAHADAAINYRQCYAAAKAVELYLLRRAED